jgi:hypothetical protein
MHEKQSSLSVELNAAQKENGYLKARDKELLRAFEETNNALHRLGMEPAHVFALSRLIERDWKGFLNCFTESGSFWF